MASAQLQTSAVFPHARSGSENDQFRGLEAIRFGVQIGKSRRQPRWSASRVRAFLDACPGIQQNIVDANFVATILLFEDAEDVLLGLLQDFIDGTIRFVAVAQSSSTGGNQRSLHRLLTDDIAVITNMGRVRHALKNFEQVGGATAAFKLLPFFELLRQCDDVDAADTSFRQGVDGRVDCLMPVTIEVFGGQKLGDFINRFVLEQQTAQHTALGIQICRRHTIGCGHVELPVLSR